MTQYEQENDQDLDETSFWEDDDDTFEIEPQEKFGDPNNAQKAQKEHAESLAIASNLNQNPYQLSPGSINDLLGSNLEPKEINARNLGVAESSALGCAFGSEGYVIPYQSMKGEPLPFYRAKIIKDSYGHQATVKYLQPKNSVNHIYFPPGFDAAFKKSKYVIITEGEKKAALACKLGFATCAVSGIDSWRNKNIILPKDTALVSSETKKEDSRITGKLPQGADELSYMETIAFGLSDLINACYYQNKTVFIAFDYDIYTSGEGKVAFQKSEVERAQASFAHFIRSKNIDTKNIRQLKVVFTDQATLDGYPSSKLGLDDFLVYGNTSKRVTELQHIIEHNYKQPIAFPNYPNPKEYIAKKLGLRLKRHELMSVILTILIDLDYRGKRLKAIDEKTLYYFDKETKQLMQVAFGSREFTESPFSVMMYKRYGVSKADDRVWEWLETLYNSEDPIEEVRPQKLIYTDHDGVYYQINDGQYVKVTKEEIKLCNNGDNGILFELGHTNAVDAKELLKHLTKQKTSPDKFYNWWYAVIREARIKDSPEDRNRRILSLLFYISPWFYKWRNTQLPVEMAFGEAGSGKSSLYEHRLNILTGRPKLKNAPGDLKDWNTSVTATGGLHVTDNLHMTDKNLRQRLSDEMCRLVTESQPAIEARKLYTDNTIVTMPVKCVFAITAVSMPFSNIDIVQRSITLEFDKGTNENLTYDSNWCLNQLNNFGGRASWIAHQLLVVQKIIQKVDEKWNSKYAAKFRLINLEQLLMLTAEVFGEKDTSWVAATLSEERDARVATTDWALEGLSAYAEYIRASGLEDMPFHSADICEHLTLLESFQKNHIFENPRGLSRYIQMNKHSVATVAGIIEVGTRNNRTVYKLVKRAPK